MVIGHYAVGFAAKRWAPRTSLGSLIAAGALLDLIWPVFLLSGIEVVAITPKASVVTPLTFISYPWSHSLIMSIAWGILFGTLYLLFRRYLVGAIIIALLVVSHWLLDFIVHVPDLPLAPGNGPRFGLGLWNSLPASLAIELSLFAIGIGIYVAATSARDRIGTWGLAGIAVFMLLIFAGAIFGPPPPNTAAIAYSDLGQLLIVGLAAWVDQHRRTSRAR